MFKKLFKKKVKNNEDIVISAKIPIAKRYEVIIYETLARKVQVKATSEEDAYDTVWSSYTKGYISLGKDNFQEVHLSVEQVNEEK